MISLQNIPEFFRNVVHAEAVFERQIKLVVPFDHLVTFTGIGFRAFQRPASAVNVDRKMLLQIAHKTAN